MNLDIEFSLSHVFVCLRMFKGSSKRESWTIVECQLDDERYFCIRTALRGRTSETWKIAKAAVLL